MAFNKISLSNQASENQGSGNTELKDGIRDHGSTDDRNDTPQLEMIIKQECPEDYKRAASPEGSDGEWENEGNRKSRKGKANKNESESRDSPRRTRPRACKKPLPSVEEEDEIPPKKGEMETKKKKETKERKKASGGVRLVPKKRTGPEPLSREVCPICGKQTTRGRNIKKHMMIHSDLRPFACPDCPKTFRSQNNLQLHQNIHTGEKPYKCEICPKSYQRKEHLERHVLKCHVVDKEFPCDLCSKAFVDEEQLRAHKRLYHDRVNYYRHFCPLCSHPAREIEMLKLHLRQKHSKESYCKPCKNAFNTEKEFELHIALEEDQDALACDVCGKEFPNVCLLCQHSANVHSNDGDSNNEKQGAVVDPKKPTKQEIL